MAAFDLTDTTPFSTNGFSLNDIYTDRAGFSFDPEWKTDLNFDTSALELSEETLGKAGISTYFPTAAKDTTTALNNTNNILGDYLFGVKEKAAKDMFWGATAKTASSAGKLFTSLISYGSGMRTAELQAENTKLQTENQMNALDNQVLSLKNKITDRFNSLMARNTVEMASKNLRVTAGALLEQTKDEAYDATQDIRTAESNAELQKIALRSQQKQADITKDLQKTLLTTNLIKGLADVGVNVASGGGTMQSWGDLYSNAFGKKSLNKSVYGGK